MADKKEFVLGNRAADLWLYTADACANDKIIPKKYRYTTGTGLMNSADTICSYIEGANDLDLFDETGERLALQKKALRECKKLERRIQRMMESKQYPGVTAAKGAAWTKCVLTVRYMCASWYDKDRERTGRKTSDARRAWGTGR